MTKLTTLIVSRPEIRIGSHYSPAIHEEIRINPDHIVSMSAFHDAVPINNLTKTKECVIKLSNGDQYITDVKLAREFYLKIIRGEE